MCTAIAFRTTQGETFLGRTMDFSTQLDPSLYIVPKGHEWINASNTAVVRNRFRFIGTGQDLSNVIFVDGVNEKGFAIAVLYFPGYAFYDCGDGAGKTSIAALELVHFLLGICPSVQELPAILQTIRIVGIPDPVTNSVAPLHWIATDRTGRCVVVERTKAGLQILENPIGVLTNSPNFEWHLTNLRNYMKATPNQCQQAQWEQVTLAPFGQGAGCFGLPGDYSPPSRFVRTAFQKSCVQVPANREEAVITGFHLLEGVTIPRGVVLTSHGTDDYTQFTTLLNTQTGDYYYRTYQNSQIATAKLMSQEVTGCGPISLGKLNRPVTFEARN